MVRDKVSKKAYMTSLYIGYFLPTAMIGLFILGKWPDMFPLPGSAGATDRLITLLGIFLTIIFVLYHDNYRLMPGELRKSSTWFCSKQNCLLFAALTVAVEGVLLTLILSVLSVSGVEKGENQVQFEVDVVLTALILELIAILILLFLVGEPDRPR